jgi:hypothetical protein
MHGRGGAMHFGGVLMRFAGAVTGKHCRLFVCGGGAQVRRAGVQVFLLGGSMRVSCSC